MTEQPDSRITAPEYQEPTEQEHGDMPVLIERMMLVFYLMLWANLISTLFNAISNTHDGNYSYLLPFGIYGGGLVAYLLYNLSIYRREGGSLNTIVWGYDRYKWEAYAYVVLSFGLAFWLSSISPQFWPVHISIWGLSLGMIRRPGAIPLLGVMVLALLYQLGIITSLLAGGDPGGDFQFIFYVILILIQVVTFTMLIGSRIKSEELVRELRQTKRRLEAALLKEREVGVLRERTRMAREMHDGLGHALALVAVKIEAAQRLQAVDPARAAAELDATKRLVRESMADLRASLSDLRNPTFVTDGLPLDEALKRWVQQTANEAGIVATVQIEAPPAEAVPSAPIDDAVWRVARESVLNVVKHARANHLELNIFTHDERLHLTVQDDGIGIAHLKDGGARLELPGHYGVRGMRERLQALGGTLTLRPGRDGKGLMVSATIPLPQQAAAPLMSQEPRAVGTEGARFAP